MERPYIFRRAADVALTSPRIPRPIHRNPFQTERRRRPLSQVGQAGGPD